MRKETEAGDWTRSHLEARSRSECPVECPFRAAGVGVRRGCESGHRAASELQGAPRRPSRRPLRRLASLNVGPPGGGTRLSVLVFLSISCPAQTFWVFTRKPRAFNTFHSSLLLRRPPLLSFENNNQQVS